MSAPTILIIEDEIHIANALVFNLEAEGYQVRHAVSGEEGLDILKGHKVDLLVLDLMLPGISGYEVCRQLRAVDPQLPVLILSARAEERDRIKGLQLGADDYLVKPFSLDEFLLRIQRMLERASWYRAGAPETIRIGKHTVNLREGMVTSPEGDMLLTGQELKLLRTLALHQGEVVERSKLLQQAWGMSPDAETRTLDNFIVRLRRYFEPDPANPRHILTVRGRGYRLVIDA